MSQKDLKERLEKITQRNLKIKHKKNHSWPLEKKIEVVSNWLVLGSLKQASAVCGVNYDLVRQWKGQPWWLELEHEIRQSQNLQTDTKLTKIIEKSLEATLDRVENGDFIYDQKSGEIRRKPANLRDVQRVAVDLIDRREVLRKATEDRNEGPKVSVEEHLKMLANQMAQWFEPKKQTPIVVLEEVEDAVYTTTDKEMQEVSDGETSGGLQQEEPGRTEAGNPTKM